MLVLHRGDREVCLEPADAHRPGDAEQSAALRVAQDGAFQPSRHLRGKRLVRCDGCRIRLFPSITFARQFPQLPVQTVGPVAEPPAEPPGRAAIGLRAIGVGIAL